MQPTSHFNPACYNWEIFYQHIFFITLVFLQNLARNSEMHTPWWIILCNTVWYEISDTKMNLNWHGIHFIHEQNEATKIMLPVLSGDALGWDFFHVFISQRHHLEAKEGTYLHGYCIQEEQRISSWTKLSADCHWGTKNNTPCPLPSPLLSCCLHTPPLTTSLTTFERAWKTQPSLSLPLSAVCITQPLQTSYCHCLNTIEKSASKPPC